MIISIIGPSGCGKGTQAEMLSERLGIPAISSGQLHRDAVATDTFLGKEVKSYIDRGVWPPDDLVMKIIRPRLTEPDCAGGFIIDGSPRAIGQVPLLDELFSKIGQRLDFVFHLDTSEETSVDRILKRESLTVAAGSAPRSDATPEAIRRRIAEYQRTIAPVLDAYEKRGVLRRINNERPIKEVHEDILKRIKP
ncbi:MAG: adenylate kinase [Deltaproteobacteria bacterium CG_4_9_14_3_um_filter_44_9]|uniref:Adenylate kinase n=1 Tax=candidate division WWE3 bacterium CG08_land_8_20_14_0_20_41_15 TaxID=1975086 RepID=A0A2H0X8V1_UNCKA|nr:MAG: adenylate kinase [candidate division WWE3 bacterium CG08_land_8_20_14_0_20_41_15]PJB42954.1 MAG: adenylate kinase [Deltaproteobacteria bacterium CG_4_9_14_3_um_filter_44_9]